MKNIPRWSVR